MKDKILPADRITAVAERLIRFINAKAMNPKEESFYGRNAR
jgi:hypothetical protein